MICMFWTGWNSSQARLIRMEWRTDHCSILCKKTGRRRGSYWLWSIAFCCHRWAVLNIAAGYQKISIHTDKMVMMAAGYLEGALTNKWVVLCSSWFIVDLINRMIYDHYVNMYNDTFNGKPAELVNNTKEWFTNQRAWVASQLNSTHSSNDVIWKYMGLINAQYQGTVVLVLSSLVTLLFIRPVWWIQ